MATATDVHDYIDDYTLVGVGIELLRFPSWKGKETEVARWVAEYLSARGYAVELQEVEPGRHQTIAVLAGTGGGRSLMFNGHLDIDPIRAGWKRDPFRPVAEGGLLYGAGARNMKAGVAAMITAAEAVRRSGTVLCGDIVLACVVGELQGGVGTTHALRQGLRTDAAIVPEPFGARHLVTTTSGVAQFAISTIGFSEHISRAERALDAVTMMTHVIRGLRDVRFTCAPRPDLPDLPRLVIGGIIGGRGRTYDMHSPAHTVDYCTVTVDVRYLPGQTRESVERDIRASIEAAAADVPGFQYEISREPRPPYQLNRVVFEPTEVPTSEEIVSLVAEVYQDIEGRPPDACGTVLPYSYTGADTSHLWRAGIPCVLYGPEGPHGTPGEADDCVHISEMRLVSRVLAESAVRFCR